MTRITEHQEQMMGELRQLKAQSPDTDGDSMNSRLTLMGTA